MVFLLPEAIPQIFLHKKHQLERIAIKEHLHDLHEMCFDSDSDNERDINIETFTPAFTLVRRRNWLDRLSIKFRRPVDDERQILAACDHLCSTYLHMWRSYASKKPQPTWEDYVQWTLDSLLRLDVIDLMAMHSEARQNSKHPANLRGYLHAIDVELEKHFEPRSEKERTLIFFVKLDPEIQYKIRQLAGWKRFEFPEKLDDMRWLAVKFWEDQQRMKQVRKSNNKPRGRHNRGKRGNKQQKKENNQEKKEQKEPKEEVPNVVNTGYVCTSIP